MLVISASLTEMLLTTCRRPHDIKTGYLKKAVTSRLFCRLQGPIPF